MTNYNALAMFEHNNTQKFMNTLFMEPGDFKFLFMHIKKARPNKRKWFYCQRSGSGPSMNKRELGKDAFLFWTD